MLRRIRSIAIPLAACLFVCSAISATKKPPPAPVNLNTATAAQLQQVPGIGPSTAEKIVQMRRSYGPFKSVNDLLSIRGIGPKKLEKMRKYLVAGKISPKKPGTATASSSAPAAKKPSPTSAASTPAAKTTAQSPKPVGAPAKSTSAASAKPPGAVPAKTSAAMPTKAPEPATPVAKAKPDVSDEEPQ